MLVGVKDLSLFYPKFKPPYVAFNLLIGVLLVGTYIKFYLLILSLLSEGSFIF